MAFNLSALSTKDQCVVHLRHPVTDELLYDGEDKKKPVQIIVNGPGSSAYRNAITAMQNRQLRRGKKQVSAEVLREEGVELLVACSVAAENLAYNGEAITDKETWTSLYSDPSLGWVRDQVDAAIGDVSNFLPS